MLALKFDVKNSERLRLPTTETQILALGHAYIAYETTLPPAKQLRDLPLTLIRTALNLAETARDAASKGEADRVNAIATYRITLSKAKEALRQARKVLEAHAYDAAQLREWGFEIILARDKPTIRLPSTNQEWFLLLASYVQHEGSLPETERVTVPAYSTMLALYHKLQESLEAKQQGGARMAAGAQVWSHEIQRLFDLLQGAAILRILNHYNGQVDSDLRAWGYEIVDSQETQAHP